MFAKEFEGFLCTLTCEGDFQSDTGADMEERFKSLRGFAKLPQGRESRAKHLSLAELTSTIFGLVPIKPGWAGHAAVVLERLKPIGGPTVAFHNASTLGAAIEKLLSDDDTANGFRELSLSGGAFGTNNNGFASLRFMVDGVLKETHYISELAASLMQPGSDQGFDPAQLRGSFARTVTFNGAFFREVRRAVRLSMLRPGPPSGTGSEYDDEEARAARAKRLGATPSSRFLNIGVDTQVTWPSEETVVAFDRYRLVLMPRTKDDTQSVHIDLAAHGLSDDEAITVINRFLSLLTWCEDRFAVAQFGWSGNPVPVGVPKRNLGFATSPLWMFNRSIPTARKILEALAHYREGRNAEANSLISYAVLSYFKVIEGDRKSTDKIKNWIIRTYPVIARDPALDLEIEAFEKAIGTEKPEEYLNGACRVAVAHASKDHPSDVDDLVEVRRLHVASSIMRALARHMLANDLGLSTDMWHVPEDEPNETT